MPRLTFSIPADGLAVDVRVNLDGAALRTMRSLGQPLPASIAASGLIDTGTDISAVGPSILTQLAVPVYGHGTTMGITGAVQVRLFKVTLFILDATQPNLPWFVLPDILVMELPSALPAEVLIGMDVLRSCITLIDGPAGHFTLDF
jgi:hypothetical protein